VQRLGILMMASGMFREFRKSAADRLKQSVLIAFDCRQIPLSRWRSCGQCPRPTTDVESVVHLLSPRCHYSACYKESPNVRYLHDKAISNHARRTRNM